MLLKVLSNSFYSKSLDKWSNRDFLLYFSNRYKVLTGDSFKIPEDAWIGMLSRIKGFRLKKGLDNSAYKNFIDNVFDKFFIKDNYVPTFGAVVSEKVFYVVSHLFKKSICTNSEFEKLRNELYLNNELFRKLI